MIGAWVALGMIIGAALMLMVILVMMSGENPPDPEEEFRRGWASGADYEKQRAQR